MEVIWILLCVTSCIISSSISLEVQEKTYYFEDICTGSSLHHVIRIKLKEEHSAVFLSMEKFIPSRRNINCTIMLRPPHKHSFIFLIFSEVFLRDSTDSLSVINENTTELSNITCPNENCTSAMFNSFKGSPISVNFFSMVNGNNLVESSHFKALITVSYKGKCKKKDFQCKNGYCISEGLVCDGHNHCGDSSNLLGCDKYQNGNLWAALTIALGALSFIILVPLFCFLSISGGKINRSPLSIPPNPTLLIPSINNESTALLSERGSLTDLSADPQFTASRTYSSIDSSSTLVYVDPIEGPSHYDHHSTSIKKPL